MREQDSRTAMLIGDGALEKLKSSRVAVFGVGGVGGYATEALARAGVGHIDLIDSDKVALSNINRQIIATHQTVGQYKTEAARDRIATINPDCTVKCFNLFFDVESKENFTFSDYDYVIDAIDSLTAKIELITSVKEAGTPIISAMGAGKTAAKAIDEYLTK